MQRRHDRLVRLARLFETNAKLAQARLAALAGTDRGLAQRQLDIFEALERPGPCQLLFADAAARQLAGVARRRNALAQEIAVEKARLQDAELRARVSNKAIGRLKATLDDMAQRKTLEELAADLARASACGKGPTPRF